MPEVLRAPLPVIFAGLSVSLTHARRLLPGIARGPVRAGDLDDFAPGQVVVIIDGDLAPETQISRRRSAMRSGAAFACSVPPASGLGEQRAR